ncbi:MAG: hypothetical protein HY081_10805 [Gammaproteobacteria bacterium]|nr:hypothetical protein [Gammaproteobacteria bacterium]
MSRLIVSPSLIPAEPLRKRAPAFDEHGNALSDFMVLFPGLIKKPQHLIQDTIKNIQAVFAKYEHAVVFAELNLKLSLLWISVRPIPGMRFEIIHALRTLIPEAKLVSHI